MIIKPGVNITQLHPMMDMALNWMEECYEELGHALIITSAFRDEKTNKLVKGNPKSKHMVGQAVDARIWNLGVHTHRIYGKIRKGLEDHNFTVILEDNHIHVQYDGEKDDRISKNDLYPGIGTDSGS